MTSSRAFAVTWDYRCPYAFNAHSHIVAALDAGALWDVAFVPFSLNQVHVAEGDTPVWDDPRHKAGLVAMEAALALRDRDGAEFLAFHQAMYRARHLDARDSRDPDVVSAVLTEVGIDADRVFADIDGGDPLATFRKEHEAAVAEHAVFGVPTFIVDDRAVFVRLLSRFDGDAERSRRAIEGVLDLIVNEVDLNELKHTSIPR